MINQHCHAMLSTVGADVSIFRFVSISSRHSSMPWNYSKRWRNNTNVKIFWLELIWILGAPKLSCSSTCITSRVKNRKHNKQWQYTKELRSIHTYMRPKSGKMYNAKFHYKLIQARVWGGWAWLSFCGQQESHGGRYTGTVPWDKLSLDTVFW